MDRFIELYFSSIILLKLYLKSNMDRFIALDKFEIEDLRDLKSNMDRFIESLTVCLCCHS